MGLQFGPYATSKLQISIYFTCWHISGFGLQRQSVCSSVVFLSSCLLPSIVKQNIQIGCLRVCSNWPQHVCVTAVPRFTAYNRRYVATVRLVENIEVFSPAGHILALVTGFFYETNLSTAATTDVIGTYCLKTWVPNQ